MAPQSPLGGAIRATLVAASLIAAVVVYSDRSGRAPVALEAFVPHKGALYDMEERQVRARAVTHRSARMLADLSALLPRSRWRGGL